MILNSGIRWNYPKHVIDWLAKNLLADIGKWFNIELKYSQFIILLIGINASLDSVVDTIWIGNASKRIRVSGMA